MTSVVGQRIPLAAYAKVLNEGYHHEFIRRMCSYADYLFLRLGAHAARRYRIPPFGRFTVEWAGEEINGMPLLVIPNARVKTPVTRISSSVLFADGTMRDRWTKWGAPRLVLQKSYLQSISVTILKLDWCPGRWPELS